MLFTEGWYTYLCTGTILNDLDPTTQIPYFITAHHCISTQAAASNLITYWNFQKSRCYGPNPSMVTQLTGGAKLLSTGSSTDYTLLRLYQNPPSGTGFAGWTAAPVDYGSEVVGIHHPQGDLKKISFRYSPGISLLHIWRSVYLLFGWRRIYSHQMVQRCYWIRKQWFSAFWRSRPCDRYLKRRILFMPGAILVRYLWPVRLYLSPDWVMAGGNYDPFLCICKGRFGSSPGMVVGPRYWLALRGFISRCRWSTHIWWSWLWQLIRSPPFLYNFNILYVIHKRENSPLTLLRPRRRKRFSSRHSFIWSGWR